MKYDFVERFKKMNDQELIDAFNRDVGNSGWGNARAAYISALRQEFLNRGYDCSAIGDEKSLSFAHKVKLEGKKIIIV